jgi:hypothetical protein
LLFLPVAIATAILALPLLCVYGLVSAIVKGVARLRRSAPKEVARVRAKFPRLARLLDLPARTARHVQKLRSKLIGKIIDREFAMLARFVSRREGVQVWFVPVQSSSVTRLNGTPLVVAIPDAVFVDFPAAFPIDLSRSTLPRIRKLAQSATATISYSEYVRREHVVGRLGVSRERTFVIPHAHDGLQGDAPAAPSADCPASREAAAEIVREFLQTDAWLTRWHKANDRDDYIRGFPFEEADFIFISSQVRCHKNLLNAIQALEVVLRRRYLPLKLVTTGNADSFSPRVIEYLSDQQIEWDVISIPRMTAKVHAAFLRLAKLTVVPSLFEGGFPFQFSESMRVGTPVVMSSIPVTREVVPPALRPVMLFDPCDPEDMARRIEYGVTHGPELYAAQRPLYEALAKRTWNMVLQEYVDVFRRAAGAAAGPVESNRNTLPVLSPPHFRLNSGLAGPFSAAPATEELRPAG